MLSPHRDCLKCPCTRACLYNLILGAIHIGRTLKRSLVVPHRPVYANQDIWANYTTTNVDIIHRIYAVIADLRSVPIVSVFHKSYRFTSYTIIYMHPSTYIQHIVAEGAIGNHELGRCMLQCYDARADNNTFEKNYSTQDINCLSLSRATLNIIVVRYVNSKTMHSLKKYSNMTNVCLFFFAHRNNYYSPCQHAVPSARGSFIFT